MNFLDAPHDCLLRIQSDLRPLPGDYRPNNRMRTYIQTHLGGGAIIQRKTAALQNIGIDRDEKTLSRFHCDYPVEIVHGCALDDLASFPLQGRELVYCDPPYLTSSRTSNRRYRYDYTEADNLALLNRLRGLPCYVILSGYPSSLHDGILPEWEIHRTPIWYE